MKDKDKVVRRNIYMATLLCILCIGVGVVAMKMQWAEAARIMFFLSFIEAVILVMWIVRARKRKKQGRKDKGYD